MTSGIDRLVACLTWNAGLAPLVDAGILIGTRFDGGRPTSWALSELAMPYPDDSSPSSIPTEPHFPDNFPPINTYPCDAPIQSVADARRRLAIVDEFEQDLRELAGEIGRMKREALQAAGVYDIGACLDRGYEEARLKEVSPPADWGDRWMIDLICPGALYDHGRRYEQLARVAAFAGISARDVREVTDALASAIHAALDGRGSELLPKLADLESDVWTAKGKYKDLRDMIAGALDRLEADQLLHAGRRIDLGHGPLQRPHRGSGPSTPTGADEGGVWPGDLPVTGPLDSFDGSGGSVEQTEPISVNEESTSQAGVSVVDGGDRPPPPQPDDDPVPSTYSVRCTDRPANFPENLWAELAELRTFLGTADRFLNRVRDGRRSTGAVLLPTEYQQLLSLVVASPDQAGMLLHEKARDLWGNLRHDCKGLTLPDCPAPTADMGADSRWQAKIGIRDDVPRMRTWLAEVEACVRQWAALQTTAGDPVPQTKPKRPKPALEDRTDEEAVRRLAIYESIIQARVKGEGPGRRAARLAMNKDLVDLAKAAGYDDGVTESLVRSADEYARNRDARQRRTSGGAEIK